MKSSLIESFNKYKWQIGITSLGLLLAGGLYVHRITPVSPLRSQISSDQMTSSTDQFFDKNAQINKVVNQIQLQCSDSLEFHNIKAIYQGSLNIMKDQYIKFTKEVRKRRRLIRKINENQYLNMVIDYQAKVKQLLQRGRLELIDYLQIPHEVFEESIHQIHQSDEKQEFYRLDQMCQKLMKQKMLKKRRMSDKTCKQILKQQLKFLKSKLYQRYYETLKKQHVKPNVILLVIHTIIQDYIYQKYGFEEQHLIYKRLDERFSSEEDVKYLTQALEKEEEILMGQILGFDHEQ